MPSINNLSSQILGLLHHTQYHTRPQSTNAVIKLPPSLHAYLSASFVIVGVGVGDSNELISELHPHFRVVGFAAAGG